MNIPFRRGNDGLTDRQRARYARRWRNSAGRAPSREEMDEIRRLTPIRVTQGEVSEAVTCAPVRRVLDLPDAPLACWEKQLLLSPPESFICSLPTGHEGRCER